jgi:peptidoglycan/xylan/chitin deacetylase (PgdA/CDA1 family)
VVLEPVAAAAPPPRPEDDLATAEPVPTPTPSPRPTPAPTPAAVRTPAPPVPTIRPGALTLRVPALMYHYISDVPANEAGNRFAVDLRVPPDLFEKHLAYLKANGYRTVSTPQLWEALNRRASLPARPVILTFDDGYADAYTNALPLLRKYGYIGTFFVTVNLVGTPGYMTWDQVRALAAAGMDVQSHAMQHISMRNLTQAQLAYQMGTSRQTLAARIGRDVRFFAYPAGEYDANAMSGAAAAGYHGSFRKDGGSLQSIAWAHALRRARVSGYASVDTFARALTY